MNASATEVLEEIKATCSEHGGYDRVRTRYGWIGHCQPCFERDRGRREAEQAARILAERIDDGLRSAGLPPRFANKTFADYRPSTKGQTKALAACERYAAECDKRVRGGACLVLIGPPGVGKTHLLCATIRACIQQWQVYVSYATMAGFLAAVKGSWEWHGAEHGADFVRPQLLILDEVWIPPSSREAGAVMTLVDERYRLGRPTLIASNLPWPQMEHELGARLCDRLLEGGGEVIPVDGKSARAMKGTSNVRD